MSQLFKRRKMTQRKIILTLLVLIFSAISFAQQKQERSLSDLARDPTSSLTAFQIVYRYNSSFHQVPDVNQSTLILMPIIPFKIGNLPNIARISAGYVLSAPDFGVLQDIPPSTSINQVPYNNVTGLQDMAIMDVVIFPQSFGALGIGPVVILPTATDPALGNGKWSVGPTFVGIFRQGGLQVGGLFQGIFDVAGSPSRPDVNTLSLQVFGGIGLPDDWSIGLSEITYGYDLTNSEWTSIPFGLRVERLVLFGDLPARVYVDAEYNFLSSEIVPKWTFRFAIVPLL
jgi:hypothetical protein